MSGFLKVSFAILLGVGSGLLVGTVVVPHLAEGRDAPISGGIGFGLATCMLTLFVLFSVPASRYTHYVGLIVGLGGLATIGVSVLLQFYIIYNPEVPIGNGRTTRLSSWRRNGAEG